MKTSEALYEAIDVLRERGWTKGGTGINRGRVCLMQALSLVIDGDFFWPQSFGSSSVRAKTVLESVTGCHSGSEFNDRYCKTRNDAIAALQIAGDIAFADGD